MTLSLIARRALAYRFVLRRIWPVPFVAHLPSSFPQLLILWEQSWIDKKIMKWFEAVTEFKAYLDMSGVGDELQEAIYKPLSCADVCSTISRFSMIVKKSWCMQIDVKLFKKYKQRNLQMMCQRESEWCDSRQLVCKISSLLRKYSSIFCMTHKSLLLITSKHPNINSVWYRNDSLCLGQRRRIASLGKPNQGHCLSL